MKKINKLLIIVFIFIFNFSNNLAVSFKSMAKKHKKRNECILHRRKLPKLQLETNIGSLGEKEKIEQSIKYVSSELKTFESQLELTKDYLDKFQIKEDLKNRYRFYLTVFKKELDQLSYLLKKIDSQVKDNNKLYKVTIKFIILKLKEVDQIFKDYISPLKESLVSNK